VRSKRKKWSNYAVSIWGTYKINNKCSGWQLTNPAWHYPCSCRCWLSQCFVHYDMFTFHVWQWWGWQRTQFLPECTDDCLKGGKKIESGHRQKYVWINSVGECIVFPSTCWHHGYYNDDANKVFITAQLFARPSIQPDTVRFTHSFTEAQEFIQGKLDKSINNDLSNDLLQNWDSRYSVDEFPPKRGLQDSLLIWNETIKFPTRSWINNHWLRHLWILSNNCFHTYQLTRCSSFTKKNKVMAFRNAPGLKTWLQNYQDNCCQPGKYHQYKTTEAKE
jgi:hypothetical protein